MIDNLLGVEKDKNLFDNAPSAILKTRHPGFELDHEAFFESRILISGLGV